MELSVHNWPLLLVFIAIKSENEFVYTLFQNSLKLWEKRHFYIWNSKRCHSGDSDCVQKRKAVVQGQTLRGNRFDANYQLNYAIIFFVQRHRLYYTVVLILIVFYVKAICQLSDVFQTRFSHLVRVKANCYSHCKNITCYNVKTGYSLIAGNFNNFDNPLLAR